MNAKEQLASMVSNKTLLAAMDRAFEERRERLNAAIQDLDDALGDCEPHLVEAVETFVQAMWKEF